MRRLIINADDLGLTQGVNRGIFHTHDSGIVTSATLMANSREFDQAVTMIARDSSQPPLGIGCHVVLLDGDPLLPPKHIPSLLSTRGQRLRDTLSSFAIAAMRGSIRESEIEAEAAAQISQIQSAGVRLSHIDAHKHAHMFPHILRPVVRAAKACGIRVLRNPFAPATPLPFAQLIQRSDLWKRYAEVKVLRSFSSAFRRVVAEEGMITTDGTFGIVATGALDTELFRAIIHAIPHGTWEFCCHPGYNDAALSRVRTRLRESREQELNVLTSEAAREIIEQQRIELISYWDLQQARS